MKYLFILLFTINNLMATAQLLSLDTCIIRSFENHKFTEELSLLRQGKSLTLDNKSILNLPAINLDASATIQNENISIPFGVPGISPPDVPTNFNRLLLNFSQTIYNGRLTAHKKAIDSLDYDSRFYKLEVRKAKIKATVTGIYGGVVLTEAQQHILEKQLNTLNKKADQLEGTVASGAVLKSDLLALQAEIIQVEQKITENKYEQSSLKRQLDLMMGSSVPDGAVFQLPEIIVIEGNTDGRPELLRISSQVSVLEAQKKLGSASRMPYIGVFGSTGIGLPGYDIFNNSIRPMALGGIQLKWPLIDWDKVKNENQLLSINQSILAYQQHRIKVQLEADLAGEREEIAKYLSLIEKDEAIISLRKQVTQQFSDRLDGGTATTTDYTQQVNAQAIAELTGEVHKIQLTLAKLNYAIIQGK